MIPRVTRVRSIAAGANGIRVIIKGKRACCPAANAPGKQLYNAGGKITGWFISSKLVLYFD